MVHRIVVVGAGYAGVSAALRLARRLDPGRFPVTVVTEHDRFVERIRLHQHAAGQRLRDRPLGPLFAASGVGLVVGRVVAVDPSARTLEMDDGLIDYDDLVLAVGSGPDFHGVPGAAEHALPVAGLAGATAIAARLDAGTVRRVTVVGGGLTGMETAAELAESRPSLEVSLVTAAALGDGISPRGCEHLRRSLRARGVAVHEDRRVLGVGADAVSLDGGEIPTDLTVWAAGFRAPDLLRDAGLVIDERGRVVVDELLQPAGHPGIHVIGDAAAAPGPGGSSSRMSCQTGLPMGVHAGVSLARRLRGGEPRPIRLRYVWQNVGLGRADGVTQFTAADDRPLDRLLTGRAAASFKEVVARSAAWTATYTGRRST
jgi:NADH:ubiquinone reductase (H+-translocating)